MTHSPLDRQIPIADLDRKSFAFDVLLAGALLILAKLGFDLIGVAGYLHPSSFLDQPLIAVAFIVAAIVYTLFRAARSLYEKRFARAVTLMCLCLVPFLLPRLIDPPYWKFRLNEADYNAVIAAEQSGKPKYHVFDWGNRNTSLGGGFIGEALVYDETDEIARSPERRSQLWLRDRSADKATDQWVIDPLPAYPPCQKKVMPFGGHFFYVVETC